MPQKFSEQVESVLYGTLLGDGSLSKSGRCIHRKFTVTHCQKQQFYLEWLREQLLELKPCEMSSNGDGWGSLRFYTPPHPRFNEMYQVCYPNGVKTITNDWLNKLTPQSLAVWYMDDGGTQRKMYGCKIATCSFSEKCHIKLCHYFEEKWDVSPTHKKRDGYFRLCFNSTNAKKFKDIIEPYVIEDMKYKLNWK